MIHRLAMAVAFVALVGAQLVAAQKGDPKRITAEDIAKYPDLVTADEVVQRIRPNFFRVVASNLVLPSHAEVRTERSLFVDGILQDRLSDLREVLAKNVVEIRLMSEVEVGLLLGKEGHVFGAIVVKTRKTE